MFEKWSFLYWLVKPLVHFGWWLFHRKIVILGKENIPRNKPVIFAGNHPNALNDDLSIVFSVPHQVVWLGRAGLFESRFSLPFLKFIRVIPVYRIRDGKEALAQNDLTFGIAANVLMHNKAIGLYPEGGNSLNRKMIQHKKAIPRIVFLAAEKTNFSIDIQIVPVGLFFDQQHNYGRKLLVQFGKPLEAKSYYDHYKQNPHKATMALRNDLHQAILTMTLNYNTSTLFEGFEALREIGSKPLLRKQDLRDTMINRFRTDQKLIAQLDREEAEHPEKAGILAERGLTFLQQLKKVGVRNWLIDKSEEKIWKLFLYMLFLLITSPLFLYGFLLNAIPFFTIDHLVKRLIKNIFFRGTFSFGTGVLLFPLVWAIETIVVSFFLHGWIYRLLFLISLPFAGKFAFHWYLMLRKSIGRFRWLVIKHFHPALHQDIHREKQEILEQIE
jgi:1-acyl-sn-glycerol-3-phosphate acyltransferase